jgi:phosphoribosylamine--glycine ligase/phosphoribosylformylglycinamidine cyclo-ligase
MPVIYQKDDYNAAGSAQGVMHVEIALQRKANMAEGNVLLGLASNGSTQMDFR